MKKLLVFISLCAIFSCSHDYQLKMDLTIINQSNQRVLLKEGKMPCRFLPYFIEHNDTISINFTEKWITESDIEGDTGLGHFAEPMFTIILAYIEGDDGGFDSLYYKHIFKPHFNPVPDLHPDNNVTFFDTLIIQ
ncbi:MAG TPA: hypothetical protein VHO70_01555 [Chitinispirillaceae bacterium]|nr:hypothetical protein [Chitinispirillaceae bacterium]